MSISIETQPSDGFRTEYAANLAIAEAGVRTFSPLFLPGNMPSLPDPYTSAGLTGFYEILTAESGKRIRAVLGVTAYRHAVEQNNGDYDERVARAVAFDQECRQGKYLVIDDRIDRSERRRGVQTVHALLRDKMILDGRDDPAGLAEHYSSVVCEIVGEITEQTFLDMPVPAERLRDARRVLSDGFIRTGIGQGWDMRSLEPGERIGVDRVRQTAIDKTAHYTIRRPWNGGEIIGGGKPSDIGRYANELGGAFQLEDDLKGTFGDPNKTGKSNQDDYRDRTATGLVAEAHRSGERYARGLDEAFRDKDKASGFAKYQQVFQESGAVATVEGMVVAGVERAIASLPPNLPSHSRDFLTNFAISLTYRQK